MADSALVISSSTENAERGSDIFVSSARFSCVLPLYVGLGRTVFTAIDRSLGNRSVVIKTRLCSEERLIGEMLSHVGSIRKLVHRNIAAMFDAFVISEESGCDDSSLVKRVCMVQENLDIDLHNLIKCGQVVSSHCRRFAFHLFSALKYAHSLGVGHFSLKPSNILVSFRDLTLKVADFGISQVVRNHQVRNEDCSLSEISAVCSSLWYHAPEVLLGSNELSVLADTWSAGCIIAEMVLGHALFTGSNETNQILKLVDALHLNDDDWTRVLHVMPNKLLKNHPFKPRHTLRSQLIPADRQVIHFLERLLTFNSNERITAEEALSDSYFAELRRAAGGTASADSWNNTCFQNEAGRGHDVGVCQGAAPNESPGAAPNASLRSSFHRQPSRDETDDIALHNFLNNHSCTSSPTSNTDDRTPSPNIFDLLNHRTAKRYEGSGKKVSEASDSDGEKEVAEISDEKLKEDLEIGNVSVELLRRLQCNVMNEDIDLSFLHMSRPHCSTDVAGGKGDHFDVQNQSASADVKSSTDEGKDFSRVTQDFIDFVAGQKDFAEQLSGKSVSTIEIERGESKSLKTMSEDDWNADCKRSSMDDCNEDSNKRNTGCDLEEKNKKKKSVQTSLHRTESQGVAGVATISRKLIMDKIESEKIRARCRRSGAQSPGSRRFDANLTSEEFDELYRLPTEHLRKEKQHAHALAERNSRSGVPDRHHRHHRHHSHDSFHGGREDRSYRDAEGACGGIDYYCYDDMAAITHSSVMDLDIESSPTSFLRHGEEFSVNTALRHEDWVELSVTEVAPITRGATLSAACGRDATSSPESPLSPPMTQSGARPKKSPRKHRAL